MKNLKLPYKIILFSVAVLATLSVLITLSDSYADASYFALAFGILCLIGGFLELLIGLIFSITNDSKDWRNGFLLSGAVLLLLSGISCGGGAALLS